MYPRQHPSEENMHSPHLTLSHHHRHYGVWHGIFGLSATVRCTMGACESSFLCVSSGLLWRRGARSLPASRATRGHFPKISEQGSESFLLQTGSLNLNHHPPCSFGPPTQGSRYPRTCPLTPLLLITPRPPQSTPRVLHKRWTPPQIRKPASVRHQASQQKK
jgi:hypothetical protein